MIRKILGTILLVIASLVIIILLTYGGPVFPHIIGPITVAVIGAALLILGKPANNSAK
jgi:hypothetical protein